MSNYQFVKSKKLSWLNFINANKADINYLSKKFKFKNLDLHDSYGHRIAQRPKFYLRSNYIFLVLQFPVYNRNTREIKAAEIDFFLTKDHLITLHANKAKTLNQFLISCQDDKNERDLYLNQSPAMLLYEILDRLYTSVFPMIDHLSEDISHIEKKIFAGKERKLITEILFLKRNIVNFRKIMQAHKSTLKKFLTYNLNYFAKKENLELFYNDLLDHTRNIWDILENQHQTIDALEDTTNALLTFKTNDIMRVLTIISVIILPLTFICAVFTMDVKFMPVRDTLYDWHKIVIGMIIVAILMLTFFKKKKWL